MKGSHSQHCMYSSLPFPLSWATLIKQRLNILASNAIFTASIWEAGDASTNLPNAPAPNPLLPFPDILSLFYRVGQPVTLEQIYFRRERVLREVAANAPFVHQFGALRYENKKLFNGVGITGRREVSSRCIVSEKSKISRAPEAWPCWRHSRKMPKQLTN